MPAWDGGHVVRQPAALEFLDQRAREIDRKRQVVFRVDEQRARVADEGRGAARECDRWLMGETALP